MSANFLKVISAKDALPLVWPPAVDTASARGWWTPQLTLDISIQS